MALIKEKMTNFGVTASYWKLGYVSIDRINKYGSLTLNLFLIKDAEKYIESYTVVLDDIDKFDEFFGKNTVEKYRDTYHAAYEYIKKYDEIFSTAKDDTEELTRNVK